MHSTLLRLNNDDELSDDERKNDKEVEPILLESWAGFVGSVCVCKLVQSSNCPELPLELIGIQGRDKPLERNNQLLVSPLI